MAVQETIAFIGSEEKIPVFLQKLMQENYRLLLVTETEAGKERISEEIEHLEHNSEVEFMSCVKNCCWEADMLVFFNLVKLEKQLTDKIMDVATQKIVIYASEMNENKNVHLEQAGKIQRLLPNSKIVEVFLNSEKMLAHASGVDAAAVNYIEIMLIKIGYQTLGSENE